MHGISHYYAVRVLADTVYGGQVAVSDGSSGEVGPSVAQKRQALSFLRERLPDREPFRVWPNSTFQAGDGPRCEAGLLTVTLTEVFVVEVKSNPSRTDGHVGTWTTPDSKRRTSVDALRLAESAAKELEFELRQRVLHLQAIGAQPVPRVPEFVDDEYVSLLARNVAGELDQQVGVAPRAFLTKLVGDVLVRVNRFENIAPHNCQLTMTGGGLTDVERNARLADSVNDVELDL